MSDEAGKVETKIEKRVAHIVFSHPKANCLSAALLKSLAQSVETCGKDTNVSVLCIRSEGEGAFCAGASFDEFKKIQSEKDGEDFFLGFANIILTIRRCPKLVVSRVQGKAVGGAVGLIAACDYALANVNAAARLSEFELGIGPFTIGPAVERKIGLAAFSSMTIDCKWRSAEWLADRGLYAAVLPNTAVLDVELETLLAKLAASSPEASTALKQSFWAHAADWSSLLSERARLSGKLLAKGQKAP